MRESGASTREPTAASALTVIPGGARIQRNQSLSRPPTLAQNGPSSVGAPDDDYGGRDVDDGYGGGGIDAFEARHRMSPRRAPPPRQERGGGSMDAAALASVTGFDEAWGDEITVDDGFSNAGDDRAFTWADTNVGPDDDYSKGSSPSAAAAGMSHFHQLSIDALRAKQEHEAFVLKMQEQTILQSQQISAMMAPLPTIYGSASGGTSSYSSLPAPTAMASSTSSPRLISTDAADAKFQEFVRKLREKDMDIGAFSLCNDQANFSLCAI